MNFDEPIGHPAEYLRYFELFNAHEFYEAHEVLEDLWAIEVDPLRTYYKGLIMMAAAMVHVQRGTWNGAKKLYRDGDAYLSKYPDRYEDFEVGDFRQRMAAVFDKLDRDGIVGAGEAPTIRLIARGVN